MVLRETSTGEEDGAKSSSSFSMSVQKDSNMWCFCELHVNAIQLLWVCVEDRDRDGALRTQKTFRRNGTKRMRCGGRKVNSYNRVERLAISDGIIQCTYGSGSAAAAPEFDEAAKRMWITHERKHTKMSKTTPKIKVKWIDWRNWWMRIDFLIWNESAECEWYVRKPSKHTVVIVDLSLQVYWVRVAGMASIANSTKYFTVDGFGLFGLSFHMIIMALLCYYFHCCLVCCARVCRQLRCHEFYHISTMTWPCVRDLFRVTESAFAQHRLSCGTTFDSLPQRKT